MKRVVRLVGLVLAVVFSLPTGADSNHGEPPEASARVYSFGVVPQFEQRKLYTTWDPIVTELSRRTGLRFKLITTLTIEDFETEFRKGGMDFVYMNPYHAIKLSAYVPLVADAAPLRGILVVRKDGRINAVRDLEGQVVAFPSPNALGAALLMRADLERLHHVKVKPLYVKTHSSVYLHVTQGLALAGGGVEKTLNEQEAAVRDALRVIYRTRNLPSHPLTAHTRVPVPVRERVRAAMLAMDKTPEGREWLSNIPTTRLISVSSADYAKMRDWGLDAYWVEFWKEEPAR